MRRRVAEILEGAKPAEMPIYRQSDLRLVMNLESAKAPGLTSRGPLARADEVIE